MDIFLTMGHRKVGITQRNLLISIKIRRVNWDKSTKNWYHFDDHEVHRLDYTDIVKEMAYSRDAYILLYKNVES